MDKNFFERVKKCLTEVNAIYRKYQINGTVAVNFPNKKGAPFLSRIAIFIINKQGGIIDTIYHDGRKK